MNEVATIPHKPPSVIERAAAVFAAAPSEDELIALAKTSATIVTITNQDGYEQCHSARMALKNARLEIARTGEDGREDAVKTSKAIILLQKSLTGLVSPEEDRLAAIEKAWDDRIKAEKEAKILAEIARVAQIQRFIDGIREWPVNAAGKASALVNQMLSTATDYEITDEVFQERSSEAKGVLMASVAALQGIYTNALTHEAEQAKVIADRAELARLKAEEADRQRIAKEAEAKAEADAKIKRDAEAKATADARAAQDAADKANRERNEMALQEIQAIHHQLIIADTGRAPYCKGGDLASIDWVIDGTEKWDLTEERFGALFAMAVKTKETTLVALRAKRVDFIARQENVAEAQRQAAEQAEIDRKNEEEWKRQAKENERIATARAAFEAEQAAARKAAEPKPESTKPAGRIVERPTAAQIVALVSSHYSVSLEMAAKWIRNAKVELESAAA